MNNWEWFAFDTHPPSRNAKPAVSIGHELKKTAVGVIAFFICFFLKQYTLAYVILGITSSLLLLLFAAKGAYFKVAGAIEWFAGKLAAMLSYILMSIIFVAVMVPFRAFNYFLGIDYLHVKRDKKSASYWVDRPAVLQDPAFIRYPFFLENTGKEGAGAGRIIIGMALLFAVLIVVAEGAFRLYGYGNPILYVSHPRVGYYLAPDQNSVRVGNSAIHINHFGMRSGDVEAAKPAGVKRVLFIGDSVTYGGSYVDQQHIYPMLVKDKLNGRPGGVKVEVLNLAVNAWGPQHQLAYLREFGAFQADVAVIVLPPGDIYRPLYHLDAVPFFDAAHPPRWAMEEVGQHLLWRTRGRMIGAPYSAFRGELVDDSLKGYLAMGELLKKAGARVAFVVTPVESALTGAYKDARQDEDIARVAAGLGAEGHTMHFASTYFSDKLGKEQVHRYYKDNVHFNTDGHALFAEYLMTLPLWDMQ